VILVVGIATSGRPAILSETLKELARQQRLPDRVLIAPAGPTCIDLGVLPHLPFPTEVVHGRRGLPAQRNAILAACCDSGAVIFFDDDFLPSRTYLANAAELLERKPHVVLATGTVLADGINGPGLSVEEARCRLAEAPPPSGEEPETPLYSAYGCNMVVRLSAVRAHGLQFDEHLPLYGWQEDTDFSRQIARFGQVTGSAALTGVHLGIKSGRSSGVKLGYSQIANPIYLIRKGTMAPVYGGRLMIKNVIANCVRSVRPEPYIDRFGRAKGNFLALVDLHRGCIHPTRIVNLD
jgi:hypothetical protein